EGVTAEMAVNDERDIFAESMSRAVIEVAPENAAAFEAMASELGLACNGIGSIGGQEFKLNDITMPMADLKETYFGTFKKVIERDL
ncbi:MAG: phosphoribosylformylglycinamidine synthase II, partial [Sulfurimonadaceae bacterium]|nr:phosphoribosylformylglycinamidine synthase II [Sulfurimonadaceae bacterium]